MMQKGDLPPHGTVRVIEVAADGYMQNVTDGDGHQVIADEPIDMGGTNLGMTPYGYLSTALGSCTSITIRMYAQRKGITLTGVAVDVQHSKIQHDDGSSSDQFDRTISLFGDLSPAQRDRILQIAEKCPVHRSLCNSAKIYSEIS